MRWSSSISSFLSAAYCASASSVASFEISTLLLSAASCASIDCSEVERYSIASVEVSVDTMSGRARGSTARETPPAGEKDEQRGRSESI